MALLVEDGTGIAGANAYISVSYADTYHADRGHDNWTGTTADKEAAIIRAVDYIEKRYQQRFRGVRGSRAQGLNWPRIGAVDSDGYLFEGVPKELQMATAEYALKSLSYGELAPDVPPAVPRQDNAAAPASQTTVLTGEVSRKTIKIGGFEDTTEYISPGSTTSVTSATRSSQSAIVNSGMIPEYPAADLLIESLLESTRRTRNLVLS